jgi:hypothetical protein
VTESPYTCIVGDMTSTTNYTVSEITKTEGLTGIHVAHLPTTIVEEGLTYSLASTGTDVQIDEGIEGWTQVQSTWFIGDKNGTTDGLAVWEMTETWMGVPSDDPDDREIGTYEVDYVINELGEFWFPGDYASKLIGCRETIIRNAVADRRMMVNLTAEGEV